MTDQEPKPGLDQEPLEADVHVRTPEASDLVRYAAEALHQGATKDEAFGQVQRLLQEAHVDADEAAITEAVDRAHHLQTIRVSKEVRRSGDAVASIVNDERGIALQVVKQTKAGPQTDRDGILDWTLWQVERLDNPFNPVGTSFNISLKSANTGEILAYQEETPNTVADDLMTKPGVLDRRKVHESISALVGALEGKGQVSRRMKIPATGFYEVDGVLHFDVSPKFQVKLPDYDRREAVRVLKVLDKLVSFYQYENADGRLISDHIASIIFFGLQAPVGYIRKSFGESRILFLYGAAHTGKTHAGKLLSYMLGMPGVITGTNTTGPQIGEWMNQTTMPLTFNKMRKILAKPEITDLIKSSTTNMLIRNRINVKRSYTMERKNAFASLILITNHVPALYIGMEDRLITVEFTAACKKEIADVRKYEELVNRNRVDLAQIGSLLRHVLINHWPTVKTHMSTSDELTTGYEIARLMYQEAGVPLPSWVKPVRTELFSGGQDEVDVLYQYIGEVVLDQLRKYPAREIVPTETGYERTYITDIPASWSLRFKTCKDRNLMPEHFANITGKYVTVKTGIIHAISEKKGIELAGGLRGFSDRITGSVYDSYHGVRCLRIPTDTLVVHLTPPDDHQESLH